MQSSHNRTGNTSVSGAGMDVELRLKAIATDATHQSTVCWSFEDTRRGGTRRQCGRATLKPRRSTMGRGAQEDVPTWPAIQPSTDSDARPADRERPNSPDRAMAHRAKGLQQQHRSSKRLRYYSITQRTHHVTVITLTRGDQTRTHTKRNHGAHDSLQ